MNTREKSAKKANQENMRANAELCASVVVAEISDAWNKLWP